MTGTPSSGLDATIALLQRGIREAINLGSFDLAETLCREGLALDPGNAHTKLLLGRVAFIKKDFATARQYLSEALQSLPTDAPAWLFLARTHVKFKDWTRAIAAMRSAFAIKPATAAEEAELGHYCYNNDQPEDAAECFSRALEQEPNNAELWNDMGSVQLDLGQMRNAERSFDVALSLKPDFAGPLRNLAVVRQWQGRNDDALAYLDQTVTLDPGNAANIQSRGAARLALGHLTEGWSDYRARFTNPAHKGWHGGIPKPRWDGVTPLKDKGVLVWSDQGLGDQILAASVLPDVIAAARNVVFACEPRLIPLIARAFPNVRAVSLMDVPYGRVDLKDVDVQASISEIGPAFRPTMQAFPKHTGYLKANPAKAAALKARYAKLPGAGPIIGISWYSKSQLASENKSVPLALWGPILQMPGVRFVSLQYGDAAKDAAAYPNIHVDTEIDAVADVDAFAAQVAAMDAVVTSSNTTVHMAGALNVPTLCLTPLVEGRPWYWFVGHDVSPWYPSVRLIWQTQRRTWDDVIARAATALKDLAC
ncbi:MAG: tetratricopeptide repeat protein [Rhodospirillaceae bacterium]|nr:tetratricopeptide repeat protein [Rhodospirillaceae bacterium]